MTANVLLGIVASVIAAEVYMWLPALALWIVRCTASRLPRMSDRYREEWTADLADIPGHVMKLLYAVDLLVGLPRLRRELPKAKSTNVMVELRGVSATASIGPVRAEVRPPSTGDFEIQVPASTSLGIVGGTPEVVISSTAPSTIATVYEGWESTSGSGVYHRHHYDRNLRGHPAYGLTVSQVHLPLDGAKSEWT